MKFSSALDISVQRDLYPLFQNQHSNFLLLHLFQPSGQDQQMVNKHIVDYYVSP